MIDTIQGTVVKWGPDYVSVKTKLGVTLKVLVPDPEAEPLRAYSTVTLYAVLLLSGAASGDGEFKLYGFTSEAERKLFKLLKGVSGIGSKSALAVCSLGLDEVVDAITNEEPSRLRVKGVGPRTTKRIVDDLRAKVSAVLV